ncbi:alpha-hydroxy-acid oxidizing protein [Xanthomonas albilineans]|uniref:alpha-hydroxy-acid oxidizing protein n=1 Tax=Xanthomonas albilineans TaxID=29447 RepID=UPI003CCEBDFC
MHANHRDFDRFMLRKPIGCDVVRCSTAACILGCQVSMPVVLGPTGLAGLIWPMARSWARVRPSVRGAL